MRYQVLNDLFWSAETLKARDHYAKAMHERGWLEDLEDYRKRKEVRIRSTQLELAKKREASEGMGPRNEGRIPERTRVFEEFLQPIQKASECYWGGCEHGTRGCTGRGDKHVCD